MFIYLTETTDDGFVRSRRRSIDEIIETDQEALDDLADVLGAPGRAR